LFGGLVGLKHGVARLGVVMASARGGCQLQGACTPAPDRAEPAAYCWKMLIGADFAGGASPLRAR
jgi:hypothetical protein